MDDVEREGVHERGTHASDLLFARKVLMWWRRRAMTSGVREVGCDLTRARDPEDGCASKYGPAM